MYIYICIYIYVYIHIYIWCMYVYHTKGCIRHVHNLTRQCLGHWTRKPAISMDRNCLFYQHVVHVIADESLDKRRQSLL